jgi:hypothetical protein
MRFLQILANQCQTGLVAQVVGQWFDDEIGHGLFTCWVEQQIGYKPLISIENLEFLTAKSQIQESRMAYTKMCPIRACPLCQYDVRHLPRKGQ